jgi:hypothetical protein
LGIKKVYRVSLLADLAAMPKLAGGQLLVADRGAAYLVLLIATTVLNTRFGLTLPALDALVAGSPANRSGHRSRVVITR